MDKLEHRNEIFTDAIGSLEGSTQPTLPPQNLDNPMVNPVPSVN
jgi:hypothetical protein